MGEIKNIFEPGSVTMNAGSSMNGNVNISGNIYQGRQEDVKAKDNEQKDSLNIGSPLHLSKTGSKIDFIRLMNAWYECGKVVDENGVKPTKKDYFTWLGKLFNIDLSHYDKDLSNSMASSVAFEKQTRIFEELKAKHEEIYNSK